jgi:hypothetical protein
MAYTPNELNRRKEIIESQLLFWSFLDSITMNKLINLFDDSIKIPDKISKYVENERRLRGMDEASIIGKVYGENLGNSTLLLEIIKHNKAILHITFHLSPKTLNSKHTGAIHISKNIYKERNNILKKKKYALIRVDKPVGKPNSLEFKIADGYRTSGINADEKELQQEMDVIIYVINRIFDENDQYYIGVKEELVDIHPRINTFLNNINKRPLVKLKNKGVRMIRKINKNIPAVPVFYNKYHKTPKGRARSPKARNVTKKIVLVNKPKID